MNKRIVVKVGTKVLTAENGQLDLNSIEHIVDQIAAIRRRGYEVLLVTSGAVGSGRALMKKQAGVGGKEETMADKQVFAAVGQVALMNTYAGYLKKHGIQSAQILVTKEDFRDRVHYRNMETCFLNVLRGDVLPIVNENDVVAVKELIFTDNDELAGLVALELDADEVIILTSVEGVMAGDPKDPNARVISEINVGDLRAAEKFVTADKTSSGRGGMLTKFAVARKLMSAGITVHMANGKRKNVIVDILDGKSVGGKTVDGKSVGTRFVPQKEVTSRKRHLAHGDSLARGSITINKCLEERIFSHERAMSILPVGIVAASGEFKKGDIIKVVGDKGKVIGCGIARADMEAVARMAGVKGGRAVIHYDDLFVY